MIPQNTTIVIMFLLRNMDKFGYNINQIAKLNNISVGSVFKILKELEKNNLVIKNEISNASHYKLNFDNPETTKLCEFLLLAEKRSLKGYAKVYADEAIKSKVKTKPVVPLIMRQEDLIKALKQKKEAIINMIKEGIVLQGEAVFFEVLKNVNS